MLEIVTHAHQTRYRMDGREFYAREAAVAAERSPVLRDVLVTCWGPGPQLLCGEDQEQFRHVVKR